MSEALWCQVCDRAVAPPHPHPLTKIAASPKLHAWHATFDNGGSLTVFADSTEAAAAAAEEKAQKHGWNLRVIKTQRLS